MDARRAAGQRLLAELLKRGRFVGPVFFQHKPHRGPFEQSVPFAESVGAAGVAPTRVAKAFTHSASDFQNGAAPENVDNASGNSRSNLSACSSVNPHRSRSSARQARSRSITRSFSPNFASREIDSAVVGVSLTRALWYRPRGGREWRNGAVGPRAVSDQEGEGSQNQVGEPVAVQRAVGQGGGEVAFGQNAILGHEAAWVAGLALALQQAARRAKRLLVVQQID